MWTNNYKASYLLTRLPNLWVRCDTIQYDPIQCHAMRCDAIWYYMMRYDILRLFLAYSVLILSGTCKPIISDVVPWVNVLQNHRGVRAKKTDQSIKSTTPSVLYLDACDLHAKLKHTTTLFSFSGHYILSRCKVFIPRLNIIFWLVYRRKWSISISNNIFFFCSDILSVIVCFICVIWFIYMFNFTLEQIDLIWHLNTNHVGKPEWVSPLAEWVSPLAK